MVTASWRDQILKEFTPQVARLTLVADPDSLLTEEGVLQGIQERGFELLPFEEPVAFRFAYESKYRARWERGELIDLVVVLTDTQALRSLPYDLLQVGHQLSFNLGNLFPNLSYLIVNALDRCHFDALYQAQAQYTSGQLGDNATKDFVLRHVFNIVPELIKQPSDLLMVLLRRHYRSKRVSAIVDDRLLQVLRDRQMFQTWPLETILPDRQAFFTFLQERWPRFVRRQLTKSKQVAEPSATYASSAPVDLPFEHKDVRVYIDNLFLEDYLEPISADDLGVSTLNLGLNQWVAVGLRTDPATDRRRRLDRLFQSIDASVPATDAKHQDWLNFTHRWAELIVLWQEAKSEPSLLDVQSSRFQALQEKVDTAFLTWVQKRYSGLYNQPALTPVMLHQIPRVLARQFGEPGKQKVALLVLDGLALDQWLVLRDVLAQQRPQLQFRSGAVFAWVPTITSVSRQAVFAGKSPIYFPGSIHKTDKEDSLWKQFWADQGLSLVEVAYAKGLGETGTISKVEEVLSHPKVRVVGLVVDKVDKIMHGMELGTPAMHNQVRQWALQGFMAKLLDQLHDHSFKVFLTSDHGNIEATGIGRPAEGAIADLRGERVRVYPDQTLRAKVKADFPSAIEWAPLGLPEGYLPLLAPGRFAFVASGKQIVGHGGISLEELVVPFIQIENRTP